MLDYTEDDFYQADFDSRTVNITLEEEIQVTIISQTDEDDVAEYPASYTDSESLLSV